MKNINNSTQDTNNRNFNSTLNKEELETVIMNVCDGIWSTDKPIDDPCMLTDMDTRMEVFDYMIRGIQQEAKDCIIQEDTLTKMAIFWGRLQTSIEDAMSLLEYVYRAKDSKSISLDDWNNLSFPGSDISDRIKERQKKYGRR